MTGISKLIVEYGKFLGPVRMVKGGGSAGATIVYTVVIDKLRYVSLHTDTHLMSLKVRVVSTKVTGDVQTGSEC